MGKVTKSYRIAPGLNALRKRYVKRAETLCSDPEFIELTRTFRARWNIDFPEFPIISGEWIESGPGGYPEVPATLDRALEEHYKRGREGDWFLVDRNTPPPRVIQAEGRWWRAVEAIEFRYWPEVDFPSRYLQNGFPGVRFIARALMDNPRTLPDKCDDLFHSLSLIPTIHNPLPEAGAPISADDDPWCGGGKELMSEFPLTVMLYPGITEGDIKGVAKALAEEAERHYGHLSTGARVRSLQAEELTLVAIAERLGLTESNVRGFLKNAGPMTPNEPQNTD